MSELNPGQNHDLEDIVPYNDEEAVQALRKVAQHPAVYAISKYLFPNEPIGFLAGLMRNLHSIDEFQTVVMRKAVDWVLNSTTHCFSYDGINNLKNEKGRFLLLSNHRDIILDPAITQYVLNKNGIPMTEICVGSNLLSNKTIEYLLRSNRMIKVIRGISARELYLSSQILSSYIRESITTGRASVWLAQRQGRTKDGFDTTEQGLLKMLDMSGTGSFADNFKELNIVPLSISYEYEPCDIRKARELLISRSRKYVKGKREDLHSIIIGIRQQKGNVHLNIGAPLTDEEIDIAAALSDTKNDRYQSIRQTVSNRVIQGYKLWMTNYIAYDMVNNTTKYSDHYQKENVERFEGYMVHKMEKVESSLNRSDLREIFLRIYSNPVKAKEDLGLL